MKRLLCVMFVAALTFGCGGGGGGYSETTEPAARAEVALIEFEPPAPRDVPAPKDVSSDTDWEAKTYNKNIEIVQVLNIIDPVAVYITAGFNQYGDRFSPTLQEEWEDTQVQLTTALGLYEDCQSRIDAGSYDKKLFLDMEEVWQLLVKTGVAGVRTKSMVDSEVAKFVG